MAVNVIPEQVNMVSGQLQSKIYAVMEVEGQSVQS